MYDVNYITHRLSEGNATNETYCEPEPLAKALWEQMPESIRPLFNPPRGAKVEGEYIGSVIQVAKGTMKRLHGPEFEMLASNMLQMIWDLDDSSGKKKQKKRRSKDPSVITFEGVQRRWDVRRYSSSRDSQGRWQTLPDFSYYIGCTASEYSNKMRKKPTTSTDTTTTTATEWK